MSGSAGPAAAPIDERPARLEPGAVKIRLTGVRKAFGPKVVLDGLDLVVHEGESLVLIGGSGSGKSVLLKHIIGLLTPDEGVVEVDGVRLNELSPRALVDFRRRFGMAFQEGALFDSMTVWENVAFPLQRAARLDKAAVAKRVEECLRLVRLEEAAGKIPAELSGGMRRRVGFARAIALEPEILLFDEPTTGLDPVLQAVVDELIMALLANVSSTAITITHDMTSAFRIADRIGMLFRGQIIAIGTPEEIRTSDDPRVQQFLQGRAHGPLTDQDPATANAAVEPAYVRKWR